VTILTQDAKFTRHGSDEKLAMRSRIRSVSPQPGTRNVGEMIRI